ncbi:GNAT family N-acetyltransferase [Tropicimonas sp.]|uniref:GNAT family N-acetyltransferase n=1 Tax=Tropicimonas sp. TaxID=2067044 RepID=UPI003A8C628E
MTLAIDELETRRFGIRCARFDGLDSRFPDLAETERQARAQGVRLVTVRVDVAALPRVHALEGAGYRLMDTLVYYGRSLSPLPETPPLPEGVSLRPAVPEDATEVAQVAAAAFRGYLGHYHADPRLDNAAADAAYVQWAQTGTATAGSQNPVLLALTGGRVSGFLSLRLNTPQEAEIVLNGVHPDRQRGGLYSALLHAAMGLAAGLGAGEMIVSTQINNYAVQKVWSRAGLVHRQSRYTFHRWYD